LVQPVEQNEFSRPREDQIAPHGQRHPQAGRTAEGILNLCRSKARCSNDQADPAMKMKGQLRRKSLRAIARQR
jgi:hypothetical protein